MFKGLMIVKCLDCKHVFNVPGDKILIHCPKCGSENVDIIKMVG